MDEHHEFTIEARYENRTSGTVYPQTCGGSLLYWVWSAASDGPGSAYNPLWSCGGSDPIVVEAGGVRLDVLRLGGPTMYVGMGGPRVGEPEGHWRLVYEVGSCPEVSSCCSR